MSRIGRPTGIEAGEWLVARGRGQQGTYDCFMVQVSFGGNENVLELERGAGGKES